MVETALVQKVPADLLSTLRDSEKGIASFLAALPSAQIVANVTREISTNITPNVTAVANSGTVPVNLYAGPVIALVGLGAVAFIVVRRR